LCELNSLPRTSFALLPHRRDSHHCNVDWNLFLFLLPWVGHALGGFAEYAEDQVTHSQPQPAFTDYLTSARFWFESFQNWQSEFLAIASMVWLPVSSLQRLRPGSKPRCS